MVIQASRLEIIVVFCALVAAGAAAGYGACLYRWWHVIHDDTVSELIDRRAAAYIMPTGPDSFRVRETQPAEPEPAPLLPHLGGPRPLGWETPAEQIERLEAELNALYAADRDRIREESDRLALELLGDVRDLEELLGSGRLAVPDWIPA